MSAVLVVCTANIARSPLLEARLQHEADRRAPGGVTVRSAGTDATWGQPAADASVRVAATWGRDLGEHRSTPVSYLDLDAWDLVLTMERAHRRRLDVVQPGVAARTFTVRELVHVAGNTAPDPASLPDAGPARLAAVVAHADRHRPRLRRRHLDVPDPVGAPAAVYDQLGRDVEHWATVLGELLFGPADRHAPAQEA